MPQQEIRVPDLGGADAVDVIEILVAPGDTVDVDQGLVLLESDKASMDVPSSVAGTVVEIRVEVGAQVSEGDVVAVLEVAEAEAATEEAGDEADSREEPATTEAREASEELSAASGASPTESAPASEETPGPPAPSEDSGDLPRVDEEIDQATFDSVYASPSIRALARELGVDLGRVEGSGRKGRIVRDDVAAYVRKRLTGTGGSQTTGAAPGAGVSGFAWPEMPEVDFSKFGPVEEQPLHRIRQLSARNLHRSWLHVPHVTQHEEADITEMEAFRKAEKESAAARGAKLTPLAFLLKATASALREFPDLRSSLHPDGDKLIVKDYVHVGVAVDTPNGLVVPAIRDVDRKGLLELAVELGDVSQRARDGKLQPKDFQGAVFTISSLGGIGGTAFTPIVNAPEVGILGVSRAKWTPVWNGSDFEPRLILPFCLSYDHRVIDGAQAARFVVHLAGLLGDVRRLLL